MTVPHKGHFPACRKLLVKMTLPRILARYENDRLWLVFFPAWQTLTVPISPLYYKGWERVSNVVTARLRMALERCQWLRKGIKRCHNQANKGQERKKGREKGQVVHQKPASSARSQVAPGRQGWYIVISRNLLQIINSISNVHEYIFI